MVILLLKRDGDYEHYLAMSAYKMKNSIASYIQKGKVEYSSMYLKNRDVTLKTVYNLASITKLYTAALLLRLNNERPLLFPGELDTKTILLFSLLEIALPKE